jgi:hypothetical protein
MKSKIVLYGSLVVIILTFIYVLEVLFDQWAHPFAQNILAAVLGAFLTLLATQMQLNRQTEDSLEAAMTEEVFKTRFSEYKDLIKLFLELEDKYWEVTGGQRTDWIGRDRPNEIREIENKIENKVKELSLIMSSRTFEKVYSYLKFKQLFGNTAKNRIQEEMYYKYFSEELTLWDIVKELRDEVLPKHKKFGELDQREVDRKISALEKSIIATQHLADSE